MDRPAHAGLRHLALHARDLEAMRRFYVDVLGFAVEWEPDADNVYLSSGIDNLALHRATAPLTSLGASPSTSLRASPSTSLRASEPPAGGALDHLGVIVRTPEDVDAWAAFLESRGVALAATPKTHRDGARSCYLHDPDGNAVQIIYHPPISGA